MPRHQWTSEEAGKAGKISGKQKKTLEWEALAKDIVGKHTDRFNNNLDEADNETFNDLYLKILKWFKPQLTTTSLDITTGGEKLHLLSNDEIIKRLNSIAAKFEQEGTE